MTAYVFFILLLIFMLGKVSLILEHKKPYYFDLAAGVKRDKIWCLESEMIIYSKYVTFDESSMLKNQHEIVYGESKWSLRLPL